MKYYRPLRRGVEATDAKMHRVHDGPGYTMDHVEETALAGPCETSKQAAVCCVCADPCRILIVKSDLARGRQRHAPRPHR